MEFSEREIVDLATFFAKRFPSYEQRAALAEAAGLAGDTQLTGEATSAWSDVIRVAAQKGKLVELVERAHQLRPEDDNLREMARVFGAGGRWRRRRWGLIAGASVAAAAGLLLWSPWSGTAPPAPASSEAPSRAALSVPEPDAAPEPDPPRVDADALGGEPLEPSEPPETDAALEIEPEPDPAPEPEAIPAPEPEAIPAPEAQGGARAEPPRSAPREAPVATGPIRPLAHNPCKGEPGQVVGYWYSGEIDPGELGGVFTVVAGVNVREQMPSAANDFGLTPVVCTLGDGWKVRIGMEPVLIPGGVYWVPFRPEDLLGR